MTDPMVVPVTDQKCANRKYKVKNHPYTIFYLFKIIYTLLLVIKMHLNTSTCDAKGWCAFDDALGDITLSWVALYKCNWR